MKSFRDYIQEVVQTQRQGIIHFYDMKPVEFIAWAKNLKSEFNGILKNIKVTSKLDGLGCLGYDTIVETLEDGKIKLGDIVSKKLHSHIKSYDELSDEIIFKRITGFSEMDESDNWIELELENGFKIEMTENHRIFLPELGCWRRADELREGDVVKVTYPRRRLRA